MRRLTSKYLSQGKRQEHVHWARALQVELVARAGEETIFKCFARSAAPRADEEGDSCGTDNLDKDENAEAEESTSAEEQMVPSERHKMVKKYVR